MRLPVPAIVLCLCAVFAAASPMPVPEDFVPQPPPTGFDPSEIYLEEIKYAGSGCKAGSVSISGNDPWTSVSLSFDSYSASIGPGIPFVERYKNCNVNFKIHHPPGVSYTIYRTTFVGRVVLETGAEASQESLYWFSGQTPENAPRHLSNWVGPKDEGYVFADATQDKSMIWSPCGAATTLNFNTHLSLNNNLNKAASGLITTEVIDHKATSKTTLAISWRNCP